MEIKNILKKIFSRKKKKSRKDKEEYSDEDEELVKERLRGLGYLD